MVTPLLTVVTDDETEATVKRAETLREITEILAGAYVERGASLKIVVEVQDKHWETIAADFGPVRYVDQRLAEVVLADTSPLVDMTIERGL